MTLPKFLAALPLALVLAAPAVANDQVTTEEEIEQTLDQDIDGDGCIMENGVCVTADDD